MKSNAWLVPTGSTSNAWEWHTRMSASLTRMSHITVRSAPKKPLKRRRNPVKGGPKRRPKKRQQQLRWRLRRVRHSHRGNPVNPLKTQSERHRQKRDKVCKTCSTFYKNSSQIYIKSSYYRRFALENMARSNSSTGQLDCFWYWTNFVMDLTKT